MSLFDKFAPLAELRTQLTEDASREWRPGTVPGRSFAAIVRPQTATRLTLASAMTVSFLSVAFSSWSVCSSTLAQS